MKVKIAIFFISALIFGIKIVSASSITETFTTIPPATTNSPIEFNLSLILNPSFAGETFTSEALSIDFGDGSLSLVFPSTISGNQFDQIFHTYSLPGTYAVSVFGSITTSYTYSYPVYYSYPIYETYCGTFGCWQQYVGDSSSYYYTSAIGHENFAVNDRLSLTVLDPTASDPTSSAISQVPEPTTIAIIGLGFASMGFARHRKSTQA